MKRTLLLIAFFCALHSIALAQTPITITYDLKNKALIAPDSLQKLKPGDWYIVKITDINQILYKVSVNHADSTISKEIPMPTFGSFPLDALGVLIGNISPQATTINRATKSADHKIFVVSTEKINVGEEMDKYKAELEKYLQELRRIKTEIDNAQLDVYKYVLNQEKNEPAASAGSDYETTLSNLIKLRSDIHAVQKDILTKQKAYLAYSEDIQDAIEALPSGPVKDNLKKTDAEIKASFTQLLTACAEAQATVAADKVKELLAALIHTENNKNKTYTSLPLQFTKEQATVDIVIEPRKPEYMLQTYKASLTFPIERKKYFGAGISFYGSTLHDDAYSLEGFAVNDSVSHYRIHEEKSTKAEIGMAALFRFGTKFGKSEVVGVHGSIGPGIAISDKVKPRLLTGGGLSFGSKHMFTVDLGFIFGYVDRLTSAYAGDLTTELTIKPEKVTVSKLSMGGFLSVGYLFKF